jgi:TRAP-type C4-dicarboxylate transport system permease small subunit
VGESATGVLRWINRWAVRASGAILLVILATVLFDIFVRYVFNYSAGWSFDLTSYGLLFVVFLGAAYTLDRDGHIRIDFLLTRLPERARLRAETGAEALSVIFVALLLWATARETVIAVRGGWVSPSIYAIPLKYIYWIMPAGTLLLLLVGLSRLTAAIGSLRKSRGTGR